jgi:hypothetical protein
MIDWLRFSAENRHIVRKAFRSRRRPLWWENPADPNQLAPSRCGHLFHSSLSRGHLRAARRRAAAWPKLPLALSVGPYTGDPPCPPPTHAYPPTSRTPRASPA